MVMFFAWRGDPVRAGSVKPPKSVIAVRENAVIAPKKNGSTALWYQSGAASRSTSKIN